MLDEVLIISLTLVQLGDVGEDVVTVEVLIVKGLDDVSTEDGKTLISSGLLLKVIVEEPEVFDVLPLVGVLLPLEKKKDSSLGDEFISGLLVLFVVVLTDVFKFKDDKIKSQL